MSTPGEKGVFRQHHRYSRFIRGGDSPSAPVAFTILATLRAKALRELSSRAATEKPVSPQPPMATKMLVPSTKASRAEETLLKRGHSVRFASKNISERVNASTTWVMGSRRCWSVGITSCCLLTGVSGKFSKSLSPEVSCLRLSARRRLTRSGTSSRRVVEIVPWSAKDTVPQGVAEWTASCQWLLLREQLVVVFDCGSSTSAHTRLQLPF